MSPVDTDTALTWAHTPPPPRTWGWSGSWTGSHHTSYPWQSRSWSNTPSQCQRVFCFHTAWQFSWCIWSILSWIDTTNNKNIMETILLVRIPVARCPLSWQSVFKIWDSLATKLWLWTLAPLVHRVAALFPPTFTGSTIFLCQVEPTRTIRHWLALAVCLGVGFELLLDDSRGQLRAGASSMDTAQADSNEDKS